ncbi:hypothetical protein FXO37_07411 [Capsicum annuum]|nr:hypothetical protein FXO37_07411 [Capsicum annuum]
MGGGVYLAQASLGLGVEGEGSLALASLGPVGVSRARASLGPREEVMGSIEPVTEGGGHGIERAWDRVGGGPVLERAWDQSIKYYWKIPLIDVALSSLKVVPGF